MARKPGIEGQRTNERERLSHAEVNGAREVGLSGGTVGSMRFSIYIQLVHSAQDTPSERTHFGGIW